LVDSFRRLKAHKHALPVGVDAEEIEASFKKRMPTVALPKKPAAQKPEKKIPVGAAA
jgi:HSP20 family molecular chaperone IbpA